MVQKTLASFLKKGYELICDMDYRPKIQPDGIVEDSKSGGQCLIYYNEDDFTAESQYHNKWIDLLAACEKDEINWSKRNRSWH